MFTEPKNKQMHFNEVWDVFDCMDFVWEFDELSVFQMQEMWGVDLYPTIIISKSYSAMVLTFDAIELLWEMW